MTTLENGRTIGETVESPLASDLSKGFIKRRELLLRVGLILAAGASLWIGVEKGVPTIDQDSKNFQQDLNKFRNPNK